MPEQRTSDWRALHGALFVILMIGALLVPILRQWPWLWLAPLAFYFAVALCVAPLRRSLQWLRIGQITARSFSASIALILLSSSALFLFPHPIQKGPTSSLPPPLKDFGAGVATRNAFS